MVYCLMAIGFRFTAIGYCKQSIELKSLWPSSRNVLIRFQSCSFPLPVA